MCFPGRYWLLSSRNLPWVHESVFNHGEEVAVGLVDSACSVAYDQAENGLHLQKALLAEVFQQTGRWGYWVVFLR
ncbi:MAG: hypothetical protein ISS52_08245 [Dehalococcoidia bacterium]|nr:hypothetical protein [Dehalococcoidia bacterium]